MTKQDVFDLCTISITHNNITYSFLKPKNFECRLLDVRLERYNNIIAHVIDQYGTSIAICYSTDGFVYDGRDGFIKFKLTPTSFEAFYEDLENLN